MKKILTAMLVGSAFMASALTVQAEGEKKEKKEKKTEKKEEKKDPEAK